MSIHLKIMNTPPWNTDGKSSTKNPFDSKEARKFQLLNETNFHVFIHVTLRLLNVLKMVSKMYNVHVLCSIYIQIPPDRLHRSHMTQYCQGYCELQYSQKYCMQGTPVTVGVVYSNLQ